MNHSARNIFRRLVDLVWQTALLSLLLLLSSIRFCFIYSIFKPLNAVSSHDSPLCFWFIVHKKKTNKRNRDTTQLPLKMQIGARTHMIYDDFIVEQGGQVATLALQIINSIHIWCACLCTVFNFNRNRIFIPSIRWLIRVFAFGRLMFDLITNGSGLHSWAVDFAERNFLIEPAFLLILNVLSDYLICCNFPTD